MRGSKGTSQYPTETLVELRNQGLSLRQIGAILGIDHSLVRRQMIRDGKVAKKEQRVVGRVERPIEYGRCISYTLPLEDVWEKYGMPGQNATRRSSVFTDHWGERGGRNASTTNAD